MTQFLVVIVTALVVIAAATLVGPRLGIASPLVLVAIGVGAGLLPGVEAVEIEPEWILQGVLPPLLYSSAVAMPAMNFRREFGAISGLSVLLVVGTSLALGVFFLLAVPDLGFAWGVALGAIVSPTDAVATSIVKGTTVSRRVVAMLDGESLLNDATALVLLRTAIVAAAAGFSFWGAVGSFAYSVAVAVAIGALVGWLNLVVRQRIGDPTVNTILSFTVPFLASVPAELLGASGLVAAVVAGIVTGIRAPRELSPQNRLSDSQNWRTVELVLEGAVFLTMGLQIRAIVTSVEEDHAGVWPAVLVAVGALLLTILVRAIYVAPLLGVLSSRSRLRERMRPRVEDLHEKLATPEGRQETLDSQRGRKRSERDLDRFSVRLRRILADMEYFVHAPLGWREGTAVVWAGMRGAVTVAAAQTLPEDTPQRSVLVLIAFAVATLSLVLQGGTIGPLLRTIAPKVDQEAVDRARADERTRIFALLRTSADAIDAPPPAPEERSTESFESAKRHRLSVIDAQRSALLDARDDGTFDADVLESVLAALDSSQIDIELRGRTAR
ncbi:MULTISPECIES: cation:proton antiporter [unclassified Rathayibacter]|uniref:cation:proton antiporter n=1 Tax=unclassified Rathayibacter TaxID=2609250 RepID=UPI0006F2BC60|nr:MULTISPECIES: cation:proton antiporter [unclassified Rathayibacter]KQQ05437.1 cation:proton antiporter [Rathayibacter sp. Leaf294]KQS13300.1 cation:proton antiporter [Rathayibacter sp. Leaf185]